LPTYLDRDLLQYDVVYASAGTHTAVFPIAPDRLQTLTGAVPVDVASA
jgi:prolyl-tRNA editing enzyme YbaK/EbsC (Cys-tRNA(Pro) deacylase)